LPGKSVAQYDTNTLTVFVARPPAKDVVVAGARIVVVYPPVAVKTPEPVYQDQDKTSAKVLFSTYNHAGESPGGTCEE
jgi:hypothetical protein